MVVFYITDKKWVLNENKDAYQILDTNRIMRFDGKDNLHTDIPIIMVVRNPAETYSDRNVNFILESEAVDKRWNVYIVIKGGLYNYSSAYYKLWNKYKRKESITDQLITEEIKNHQISHWAPLIKV